MVFYVHRLHLSFASVSIEDLVKCYDLFKLNWILAVCCSIWMAFYFFFFFIKHVDWVFGNHSHWESTFHFHSTQWIENRLNMKVEEKNQWIFEVKLIFSLINDSFDDKSRFFQRGDFQKKNAIIPCSQVCSKWSTLPSDQIRKCSVRDMKINRCISISICERRNLIATMNI